MNPVWLPSVAWVGLWSAHSRSFLWVLMALTTVVFALPLFLAPITWAGWFRWRLPREEDGRDLAVYFGRCLGAFVLVVEGLMLHAALTGAGLVYTFQVLIAVAVMMVLVHVRGALEGRQPMAETFEIGMYGGLGLLAALFYPG